MDGGIFRGVFELCRSSASRVGLEFSKGLRRLLRPTISPYSTLFRSRWAHNPKVGGSNPPPATNRPVSTMSRVSDKPYLLYILWSASAQRCYSTIINSMNELLEHHNSGNFDDRTKRHRPWTVVFSEAYSNYAEARRRELDLNSQKGCADFFAQPSLPTRRSSDLVGLITQRSVVQIHPPQPTVPSVPCREFRTNRISFTSFGALQRNAATAQLSTR